MEVLLVVISIFIIFLIIGLMINWVYKQFIKDNEYIEKIFTEEHFTYDVNDVKSAPSHFKPNPKVKFFIDK